MGFGAGKVLWSPTCTHNTTKETTHDLCSGEAFANESEASTKNTANPPSPPTGTLDDPILVQSAGDEQFAGCTGFPADSHVVHWLCVSPPPPFPLSSSPSSLRPHNHPTNTPSLDFPSPPRRTLPRMRQRLPHGIHRTPRRPARSR